MTKQRILGVGAFLVIVASGAWLARFYASSPASGEPIAFTRPAACSACGAAYAASFGKTPARCERCGAETLWPAMKCANPSCGAVVPLIRKADADKVAPACAKCGETRLREVRPEDLK